MTATWMMTAAALQLAFLMAVMALAWLAHRLTANAGWIDAIWAFGVGVAGIGSALIAGGQVAPDTWARHFLVAAMAGAWSTRLGWHLVGRSRNRPDDPRYAELIHGWGDGAPRELFVLLQKQAMVSLPLIFGILIAASNPKPGLTALDGLALSVCLISVGGAWVADSQLRRFKSEGRRMSMVCETGLWRYTRHPNYFFEWLYWCAYPLFAADLAGSYPQGLLALLAPVTMYWLLRHVSGIPPLEDHMLRAYGGHYRTYQQTTSAFFPWRKKS